MKEVLLNTIENKKDVEIMIDIIQEQLFEQGYDVDTFSFEIKVFFKSWRNSESSDDPNTM